MKKYKCLLCGYIYDDEKEKIKFEDLSDDWKCPLCGADKSAFEEIKDDTDASKEFINVSKSNNVESYLKEYIRNNDEYETHMNDIHMMAITGNSIISAMGTKLPLPSWNDILILGNQLNPTPLLESEEVNTKTVIGKNAKKPMILDMPIYITHMSFGALSKSAKIALAKGSAKVKTAMCSGEGGILPEEKKEAYKYIFEIIPNFYSFNNKNLKESDAIEIKIGQGTKPGMGGHLPASKVTPEIAKIRGKKLEEDIISPSKFKDINTKESLKNFVDDLRKRSDGRPIGIKIAAGKIEKDLEYIAYAKPDFITIDGRGGSTAASPKLIKDATSVPTIYALYRARKYLDEHNLNIDLVITGGFRVSTDIAKALAMGADAVAIGTASMMAIACQQYRICQNGMCPVGVATQNKELENRIKIDLSAKRLENFLTVTNEELKTIARITGHNNVHDLNKNDIVTTNKDIYDFTDIDHI